MAADWIASYERASGQRDRLCVQEMGFNPKHHNGPQIWGEHMQGKHLTYLLLRPQILEVLWSVANSGHLFLQRSLPKIYQVLGFSSLASSNSDFTFFQF